MPALISGDPEKLKIAFLNIIINAIEAIHHENGVLKMLVEENHDSYVVKITDNGSGISEENVARLFEPYFTSKRNGLGLGLAATLAILQSHKSVIDVKTKIDRGTTFILSFPKLN
jgi:C4-dicarboxylate-specific signal transduction histidine kinase